MKRNIFLLGILAIGSLLLTAFLIPEWGFFGHRKINRMAVFTLPEAMLPLYKKYIDYIEEHAVDPDKRRYATVHEAVRHYIDLDQWGSYPFDSLPRNWTDVLVKHTVIRYVPASGDTLPLRLYQAKDSTFFYTGDQKYVVASKQYRRFYQHFILPQYYEDEWSLPQDSFNRYFGLNIAAEKFHFEDTFSQHGILPYYLPKAMEKLTAAFAAGDVDKVLRFSAEIGHYIGDAHVPLHTTKNYNGQLTDQVGIHAFWESRLPELFADESYDFFVGKATYIKHPESYFWDIVLESHINLPAVLEGEKYLSTLFPSDRQFCYDERLGKTVRIQCKEYAKAYHDSMKGMVEDRMGQAIQSIGSAWYTAWVNAGQPDLLKMMEKKPNPDLKEEPININPVVKAKSRDHESQ
ncbi:MAG: hypothetical protein IPN29_08730 [Saprospiraceae bacterium]|nr:hypothetical protein [Saprospiraceae bacterium]